MVNITAIEQISRDFSQNHEPFDEATLPEKRALEAIDNTDTLQFLFYGVSLDYNRSADQLWNNCLELYNQNSDYFTPPRVFVEETPESLSEVFKNIGFRYGNRDARGWWVNSKKISQNYNTVDNLLRSVDYHAPSLVSEIRDENFMYLSGDKLAPFFAKVVDANYHDLDDVWRLDIPVDVHIRQLTHDLHEEELSDDDIREFWRHVGEQYQLDPMTVDTAFWLIGNQWDEWGQEYWSDIRQTA